MSEDNPAPTLAAVVRCAIAATCRRYVGRRAEAMALRAQTAKEWRSVVDDCDRKAPMWSSPTARPTLHATAVAARLMAEDDAETAARELAAVRGQTVEAWREEHTRVA